MQTKLILIYVTLAVALISWLSGTASLTVVAGVIVVAIVLLFLLPPTFRYFFVVRPQKTKAADALVLHKRAHPSLYYKP